MKNEMIMYYDENIVIYEFSITISADLSMLLILTQFREWIHLKLFVIFVSFYYCK